MGKIQMGEIPFFFFTVGVSISFVPFNYNFYASQSSLGSNVMAANIVLKTTPAK